MIVSLLMLLSLYGMLCSGLYALQDRLIFKPTRDIVATPQDFGWTYETVWLAPSPERKERLHGWWIPAKTSPSHTLLFFHGTSRNVSANLELAGRYLNLGLSVLMIDYRGYGLSEGDFPSEAWAYEDAEAAYQYLIQHRQIDPKKLLVFGHSLGGAIAINLAQQHPEIGGLIVQSTFTSMQALAKTMGWPNFLPLRFLLHQRFNSLAKVVDVKSPRLWLHGQADSLIPYSMSQSLHQRAPDQSAIQIFPDAGHNDVAEVGGADYDRIVQGFMAQIFA